MSLDRPEMPIEGNDRPEDAGEQPGLLDAMIDSTVIELELPVPLSEHDRLELGEGLASAQNDVEQMQAKKKSLNKECDNSIQNSQERVSTLARQLRYGKKQAKVQCRQIQDYRLGWMRTIRLDDGTEVKSRPMTAEERQMGMHFPDHGFTH